MRPMPLRLIIVVLTSVVVVFAGQALSAGWSHSVASAYSASETVGGSGRNGCDGSRLLDRHLSFASLTVPCGARVRFCVRGRCVVAVRRDSGPYVAGRTFDLNIGVVRALGFRDARSFGARVVA